LIFVDTSAWFAASVPDDQDHAAAASWLAKNQEPLVTTDYVLDELLTLLKARGERQRIRHVGQELLYGELARIQWITPEDVHLAWKVFEEHRDKDWSFTDCTSRVVLERLGVGTAFAFDQHFRQFGTVAVVPT
jgi:uncharacterized protein